MPKIASKIDPTFEGYALDADRVEETDDAKVMTALERTKADFLQYLETAKYFAIMAEAAGRVVTLLDFERDGADEGAARFKWGSAQLAALRARANELGIMYFAGVPTPGIYALDTAGRVVEAAGADASGGLNFHMSDAAARNHGLKFVSGAPFPGLYAFDTKGRLVEALGVNADGGIDLNFSAATARNLGFRYIPGTPFPASYALDPSGRLVELYGSDSEGAAQFRVSRHVADQVGKLLDLTTATSSLYPSPNIAIIGDSMSAMLDSPDMQTRFGDRTVSEWAVGGQTAMEVMAHFGPIPALLSVTGASIPASGAVIVTAYSQDLLFSSGTSGAVTVTGTLAGVHGTLSGNATAGRGTSTYTFTRSVAGSVVACPANTPFIPDALETYRNTTNIYCFNRNSPDFENAILALETLLALPTTKEKRWLFRSTSPNGAYGTNPASGGEIPGSAGRILIDSINDEYAFRLGDRFIDERAFIVNNADRIAAALGVTLTSYDADDLSYGIVPRSFRGPTELVHYSPAMFTLLNSYLIVPRIRALGW